MNQCIWALFKLSMVLIICSIVFYTRMFFPFHTAVALSASLAAMLYFLHEIYLKNVVGARPITFLAAGCVLFFSGYAAFEYHTNVRNPILVPDYFSMRTTPVENVLRRATFPVYETVMKNAADIKIRPSRYMISQTQIDVAASVVEPGDIILLRRNNYLSNLVTDGFWKHSVLYCGSINEISAYFNGTYQILQGLSLRAYISQHMPAASESLSRYPDRSIEAPVIESTSRGVVITPLGTSIQSDYLVILRPRVSKEKKLAAILYALTQYGKPYDFLYDFSNDRALCCSELIYNAYFPHDGHGLFHDLGLVKGRWTVTPNDFLQACGQSGSQKPQYTFILYLEGKNAAAIDKEHIPAAFRLFFSEQTAHRNNTAAGS